MKKLADIQIRDPFIFRKDDIFYLYGSTDKDIWKGAGTGFDVYRSSGDLSEFEGPFEAFRPDKNFWSEKNFWAPEVYSVGGFYYMFATFQPKAGRRGTAILKADNPLGPFLPWSAGPVTPKDWECLDGTLGIDKNGKPHMIFCHEWQQVGDGEICLMPLSDDLKEAAGAPKLLFTASSAKWAKPLADRAHGSYVTDGPNLYRSKDNSLLMLWSSFVESQKYCIGVARSQTGDLAGPWVQSETPLYEADGGHGMLFTAQDDELYLAIHTPNSTPNERAVFLRVTDLGGELKLTERIGTI